jgi:D-alanine-D-alanine ligase
MVIVINMRCKIAVLTGGSSSEREVALRSAEYVVDSLGQRSEVRVFDFPSQKNLFLETFSDFDCVVPVFHGKGGEDGEIQLWLEELGVPFVFSLPDSHALGMDKVAVKKLIQECGFFTPKWETVLSGEKSGISSPCVLKPIDEGSSLGVHIVHDDSVLDDVLGELHVKYGPVLVEQFVKGREFSVGIVDRNGEQEALPVVEIILKNGFFDFESKYTPGLCEEICPAQIDKELARVLQEVALKAHVLIGARHLSRSDLIVDEEGGVWFLEINTIPGLTKTSLVPQMLKVAGYDFGDLLKGWIESVKKKTA